MKYIVTFIALLIATVVACLVISSVVFAASVDKPESTTVQGQTDPLELKVTTIYDIPMSEEHQQLVHDYCKMFGQDERLIYGVIYAESNFEASAVNEETGCYGYMQLNPLIYDPARFGDSKQNLYAGIAEITRLMCTYGDPTVALLSYNNGEAGAQRLISRGVTDTSYTWKVLKYAKEIKIKGRLYEKCINGYAEED